ncbi:MAG: ATP-binding protein [Candidatus Aenigmarchaeota archaeon]|nr:ATP-binding protein [Candidatus Aenigmarchaeota archaeon]
MKIVASTGGKGGTGKSTFAILFSFKLVKEGNRIVLCDLDIECPNDYLLLNQELKNPELIYQEFPRLDKEKCKKCGICSNVCKEHAIFWVKQNYPIFIEELCSACGACWIACPSKAITQEKKVVGEIFLNQVKKDFFLLTGRSKPVISETGPIVRKVKEKAINFAKEIDADYLIIDTSPGTHCNVIQALIDIDKAYCVTEPTPLGAYDLRLILKLTKKLGINSEIVLNKSNIGNRRLIEEIAREFGVKIVYEIPYSEEVIRAYCEKDLEKISRLII